MGSKLSGKRTWLVPRAWAIVALSAASICLFASAKAAAITASGPAPSGPVPLIVDTDMFSDADDAGALATAFALQLRGEAKVIAVAVNTRTDRPAVATNSWKCVAAIDNFYGFPDVPIGTHMPNNGTEVNIPDFVGPCAKLAPTSTPAPDTAVNVYRRALASQADGSVVVVSIGYLGNLADLLNSPPDAISPLSGRDLVAQKVNRLVVMGGGYPSMTENNLAGDPAAAADVSANWPTKIVWSGYEVGDAVHTGETISSTHPPSSPVRVAYEAYSGPGNWIPSYDLTAVYHAVRPTDPVLSEVGPGTNAIDGSGGNVFTMGSGNQYYLSLSDPTALDGSIEALLDTLPPGRITGTVVDASSNRAIAGAQVQAYNSTGDPVAVAETASDGTYTLSGLPSGGYEVGFSASSNYLPQFYNDKPTLATADPVLVAAGSTSTGVSAALATTPRPPSNSAAPTLSGTAQPGQTLTESHGSWTNSPTRFTYQWEDCDSAGAACSAIAGATSQAYTVAGSDVGHTIRVEEFASNAAGTGGPAASAATAVVQLPSPPPTSPPPPSPPPPSPPPTSPPPTSPPPTSPPAPPPIAVARVSSTKIRASLVTALAAHGNGATIKALVSHGGYSFPFAALSPGRLLISWYHSTKRGKNLLVAHVAVNIRSARVVRIKLVLTREGRKLLASASTVDLTVRGSFTPFGQATTYVTKTLHLKRGASATR